jgi:hypothetical protein
MIVNFIYAEIVYMNIVTFCTEHFTLIYYWRGLVLSPSSCEYWSAVLTSRPPGQPADISFRTKLELCCRELCGGSCSGLVLCTCCQYQLVQFSSDPVFFSHSEGLWPRCITLGHWSLGFGLWASSRILNTRKHNVLGEGKTEIQLNSYSETLWFLVLRIPND